jgi:arylsulfatase A-like enzyme
VALGVLGAFAAASCGGSRDAGGPHGAPRNLLVISVDTLRRDHVGFHGASPSPTPALDALAAEATVFADAFTVAPVTLPAHTSLLTGLYPAAHGVRDNGTTRVPPAAVTLAERLKAVGYRTHAVVGGFVLNECFGLAQGFDTYDAPQRGLRAADMHAIEARADAVVDRGLAALDASLGAAADAPFFLFLHLFDPHFPYEAPGAPAGLSPTAAYDAEVAYVDRELGRLFAGLRARGLFDELVLVFASDHGEGLEDGREISHGYFVYDQTMRIPLFVKAPGIAPGRVGVQVSLIDVVPTVLELLGLRAPAPAELDGTSLVAAMRGGTAPARTLALEAYVPYLSHGWAPFQAGVNGALKLVRGATVELYDRAADPDERNDLHGKDPREAELAAQVERLFSDTRRRLPRESVELDAAGRAALAALGYAGPAEGVDDLRVDLAALPDTHARFPEAQRLWAAFALIEDGQDDAARAELRALVQLDPRNPDALISLAKLLVTSPQTPLEAVAEAEQALVRARALRPLDSDVPWLLARCATCRATQAKARMQAAPDEEIGRAEALEWRAQTARRFAELEHVLALEPGHVKALGNLAAAHFEEAETSQRVGRPAEARAHLAKTVELADALLERLAPEDRASYADLKARATEARARIRSFEASNYRIRAEQVVALPRPRGVAVERNERRKFVHECRTRRARRRPPPLDRQPVLARRPRLQVVLELRRRQLAAAPLPLPIVQPQEVPRPGVQQRAPRRDALLRKPLLQVLSVEPSIGMDPQADLDRVGLERDAQVGVAVRRVEILPELRAQHAAQRALLRLAAGEVGPEAPHAHLVEHGGIVQARAAFELEPRAGDRPHRLLAEREQLPPRVEPPVVVLRVPRQALGQRVEVPTLEYEAPDVAGNRGRLGRSSSGGRHRADDAKGNRARPVE